MDFTTMTREEFINFWGEDALEDFFQFAPDQRNLERISRDIICNFWAIRVEDLLNELGL